MHVKTVRIRSFKTFSDLTICDLPETARLVVMVGPNGCGKSTLFKTIFGTLKARKGAIYFKGKDITDLDNLDRLKLGISFCPQGQNVFPMMTVQENLEMGVYIREDKAIQKDIDEMYNHFPILYEKRKELAGNLSGGQQQILETARALLLDPDILLFDEPSMGLAPKPREFVFDEIQKINKAGKTILLVEQNAKKGLSISDYAYVLEQGKNKYEGPSEDIMNDPKVKKLYLGG